MCRSWRSTPSISAAHRQSGSSLTESPPPSLHAMVPKQSNTHHRRWCAAKLATDRCQGSPTQSVTGSHLSKQSLIVDFSAFEWFFLTQSFFCTMSCLNWHLMIATLFEPSLSIIHICSSKHSSIVLNVQNPLKPNKSHSLSWNAPNPGTEQSHRTERPPISTRSNNYREWSLGSINRRYLYTILLLCLLARRRG